MLSRRYNIAPRVLISELRGKYSKTKPLSKVELDIIVAAFDQCEKHYGIKDLFNRLTDDGVRYALDTLSESI